MNEYPHMCRIDHQEIGHSDSDHEQCPLCRANDHIEELEAALEASEYFRDEEGKELAELQRKHEALVDILIDEGYWNRISALLKENDDD